MNNKIDESKATLLLTADHLEALYPMMMATVGSMVEQLVRGYSKKLNWAPRAVSTVLAKAMFAHGCYGLLANYPVDPAMVDERTEAAKLALVAGLQRSTDNSVIADEAVS